MSRAEQLTDEQWAVIEPLLPKVERREMGLQGRRYFEAHFERHMLLERLENWLKDLVKQPDRCAS